MIRNRLPPVSCLALFALTMIAIGLSTLSPSAVGQTTLADITTARPDDHRTQLEHETGAKTQSFVDENSNSYPSYGDSTPFPDPQELQFEDWYARTGRSVEKALREFLDHSATPDLVFPAPDSREVSDFRSFFAYWFQRMSARSIPEDHSIPIETGVPNDDQATAVSQALTVGMIANNTKPLVPMSMDVPTSEAATVDGAMAIDLATHDERFLNVPMRKRMSRLSSGAQWRWVRLDRPTEGLWGLIEHPHRKEGRGVYMLREPRPGIIPIFLQAPHRYHDLGTLRILERLIKIHPYAAIGANTTRRFNCTKQKTSCRGSGKHSADFARRNDSHFLAISKAFSEEYLGSGIDHQVTAIVQLHGFGVEVPKNIKGFKECKAIEGQKRTQPKDSKACKIIEEQKRARSTADFIVSTGSADYQGTYAQRFTQCIRLKFGSNNLLFGRDVFNTLGATSNPVGQYLRQEEGRSEFLHIEISRPMRNRLLGDGTELAQFSNCLINTLDHRWSAQ